MTDDIVATIAPTDMTGDQLALESSERVVASTPSGRLTGGRVTNGCQVFLNVPYGLPVPRWTDPEPLGDGFDYGGKEYTTDAAYCAQPTRYYTLKYSMRDRLGQGQPTETPFHADIYVPSNVDLSDAFKAKLPVRVFIHGGFMQFGSTSGQLYNQQFFAAEEFDEVRVLLGHRISVLGFLGSANPPIPGNYGFKDCWLGLQWVQKHISAFGGDPAQVHLSGLSGGGHIVGQLLHYAARQSAIAKAPFVTALLQSNAVIANPLRPVERDSQVAEICARLNLGIDPASPDVLDVLRDATKVPIEALIRAVQGEGDAMTFRGVQGKGDGWVEPDMMEYQRDGRLARDLKKAGVRCVIAGDVRDEQSFYKYVHLCESKADVVPHLHRFYPDDIAKRLLESYPPLSLDASADECNNLLGRIFADAQVHLPVRLIVDDLTRYGFPTVRYAIEMVAEKLGTKGVVPHASDLVIQHYRRSMLSPREAQAVCAWREALEDAVKPALSSDGAEFVQRPRDEMLVLSETGKTFWGADWRWPQLEGVAASLGFGLARE